MTTPEKVSQNTVAKVMQTKRLAHSLLNWVQALQEPRDSYNPDQLYLTASETVSQADPNTNQETLLASAKQAWTQNRTPTECEIIGTRFREWLAQQDQHPGHQHPRLTYIMATILDDVRRSIPNAPLEDKLDAVKGLWKAHMDRI